jgi:hypothetical protein
LSNLLHTANQVEILHEVATERLASVWKMSEIDTQLDQQSIFSFKVSEFQQQATLVQICQALCISVSVSVSVSDKDKSFVKVLELFARDREN